MSGRRSPFLPHDISATSWRTPPVYWGRLAFLIGVIAFAVSFNGWLYPKVAHLLDYDYYVCNAASYDDAACRKLEAEGKLPPGIHPYGQPVSAPK